MAGYVYSVTNQSTARSTSG